MIDFYEICRFHYTRRGISLSIAAERKMQKYGRFPQVFLSEGFINLHKNGA